MSNVFDLCDELIGLLVATHCPQNTHADEWDFEALEDGIREQFNINVEVTRKGADQTSIAEELWQHVEKRLDERLEELGRQGVVLAEGPGRRAGRGARALGGSLAQGQHLRRVPEQALRTGRSGPTGRQAPAQARRNGDLETS